ncbi:MAG: hypothetical protein STSR0007_06140 [Thermovirga sp.]
MSSDRSRFELDRLVGMRPRWLVRWGMTILFAIMVLAFAVMKYVLAP